MNVESSGQALMAVKRHSVHVNYSQAVPRQISGLHLAAYFGFEEAVKALLQKTVESEAKDSHSRTPLSWAATYGHDKVVRLLLDLGKADVESKDLSGQTPLSWAAANGHDKVVRLLLDLGKADVESTDVVNMEVSEQLAHMLFGDEEMVPLYGAAVAKIDLESFLRKHDIMIQRYLRDLRRSTADDLLLVAIRALASPIQRQRLTGWISKMVQAVRFQRHYLRNSHLTRTAHHAESESLPSTSLAQGQAVDSESDGSEAEVSEEGDVGSYDDRGTYLNLDISFFLDGPQFQTFKARMYYLVHPPADISAALALDNASVLKILLEKRLKYVAKGEYSWISDLKDVGYTCKEIAELLYERAHDAPWIYFQLTDIPSGQIQCDHHLDCCAHSLFTTSGRDDRLAGWPDWKGDQEVEIRRCVEELCGLGGISPSSRNMSSWNGTVHFEEQNSVASLSYSLASPSLNATEDVVSRLILIVERFATAASLVQHASFCCESFTILRHSRAEDGGAATELKLVRISFSSVVRVLKLLKLLGQQFNAREDLQPTLKDLQSASHKIIGPIFHQDSSEGDDDLLHMTLKVTSLAIQYVCVAFLSYSQAHIGHIQPFFLDVPLQRIHLLGLNTSVTSEFHLTASLVKLTCLGGMTQGPVLVFDASATVDGFPLAQQSGMFDVCAAPEDVLDTWGPGQLIYMPGHADSPLAIKLGGGYISPPFEYDNIGKYHWDSALNLPTTAPSLKFGHKIVIGSFLHVNLNCQIDEEKCWHASSWKLEELGASQSYYDLIEKQVGIQGGPDHFSLTGNLVWAKMPGQTIKRKRLGDPKGMLIAFLDCCWGVRVSFCTGIAQRVRLRDLVADVLPAFAETFTTMTEKEQWDRLKFTHDIITTLKSRGQNPQSIPAWLCSLPDSLGEFVCNLVRWILATLADTGLSSNGEYFSVAWPWNGKVNRCFRIPLDGHSKWALMMADSDDCATFAYITKDCLQTDRNLCRGPNPPWQNHIYLLETSVVCPASAGPGLWTVCPNTTYFFRKLDNDLVWVKATVAGDKTAPAILTRLTSIKSLPRDVRQRLLFKGGWKMQKRLKEKDNWSVTAEMVSILSQTQTQG
ncbi:hypothetical protein NLG97_g235 [Lecanicillium saksenae]|uniref:Uncharacterized protein n=1 Tax=Lecanicillium saksenae TaxID=468837 RepID=A0ACC1R7S5_9HYPO|nr:hypothetical protein NLG97_g235 [Lecanicillium saksenae]